MDAEQWSATGAVAAALVAIVGSLVASMQARSAKMQAQAAVDQAASARRSANATEEQAAQAVKQAESAIQQAEAAFRQADAAEQQLQLMVTEAGKVAEARDDHEGPNFIIGKPAVRPGNVDVRVTMVSGPDLRQVTITVAGQHVVSLGSPDSESGSSGMALHWAPVRQESYKEVRIFFNTWITQVTFTLNFECIENGGKERQWKRSERIDIPNPHAAIRRMTGLKPKRF